RHLHQLVERVERHLVGLDLRQLEPCSAATTAVVAGREPRERRGERLEVVLPVDLDEARAVDPTLVRIEQVDLEPVALGPLVDVRERGHGHVLSRLVPPAPPHAPLAGADVVVPLDGLAGVGGQVAKAKDEGFRQDRRAHAAQCSSHPRGSRSPVPARRRARSAGKPGDVGVLPPVPRPDPSPFLLALALPLYGCPDDPFVADDGATSSLPPLTASASDSTADTGSGTEPGTADDTSGPELPCETVLCGEAATCCGADEECAAGACLPACDSGVRCG